MRERQPKIYRHFDLPVEYFVDPALYEGPRLRGVEADQNATVDVNADFIQMVVNHEPGLQIAALMAKDAKKEEDRLFTAHYIGSAALPSAWRFFAEGAHDEVMRRRLELPYLAVDSPELRASTDDLLYHTGFVFDEARRGNAILIRNLEEGDEQKIYTNKCKVGRLIGYGALTLASAELGDQLIANPLTKADTQLLVRQRGLNLLKTSRQLAKIIQVVPTLDQLADYDSPLAVQLRRDAPDGAWRAYHQAREIVGVTNDPELDTQELLDEEQLPVLI